MKKKEKELYRRNPDWAGVKANLEHLHSQLRAYHEKATAGMGDSLIIQHAKLLHEDIHDLARSLGAEGWIDECPLRQNSE